MNELAWYKKRMADPTLDTRTYLEYWKHVQMLEFNYNRSYHEGLSRPEPQLVSK